MSTVEIEVVEAFMSIGVPPEKAMAAAATINKRGALADVAGIKSDLSIVKWMAGLTLAMSVANILKLVVH